MRYYLISQDKGYTNVPKIMDIFKTLSSNHAKQASVKNLERRNIITMKTEAGAVNIDILAGGFFLVSEIVKECMVLYEPNMVFKEMILLDKKRKVKQHYFLPEFVEIDCLTENSEFSFGHLELKRIEIDEKKIKDKAVFRIAGIEKDYIIARLDVVESLLRRGIKGMAIEEVSVRKSSQQGGLECQNKTVKYSIW